MHGYLVQGRYCKVEVGKTKDWCTRSAILKTTISDHKTYLAAQSIALALALSRDDSESKEARVGVEFGCLSYVQALIVKMDLERLLLLEWFCSISASIDIVAMLKCCCETDISFEIGRWRMKEKQVRLCWSYRCNQAA